jgi:hypothetical protein
MSTINRAAGVLLLVLVAVSACQAQGDIEYYWADKDEVYLWLRPDHQPLKAKYDNRQWRFSEQNLSAWEQALADAAKKHYNIDRFDYYQGQVLWQFMLARLGNDPDNARWAKKHIPAAEIYLITLPGNVVRLTFLPQQSQQDGYYTYVEQNGKWGLKNPHDNVPLNKILKIGETPEAITDAFSSSMSQDPPPPSEFWDWLIRKVDKEDHQPLIYRDANREWQWLWLQKLAGQNATLPVKLREMPRPSQRSEPSEPQRPQGQDDPTILDQIRVIWQQYRSILLLGAIPVIGLLIVVFIFRQRLPEYWALFLNRKDATAGELIEQVKTADERLIPPSGLEALHKLVTEPYLKPAENEPDREVTLNILNWAYQKYASAADSPEYRSKLDDLQSKTVEGFFEKLSVDTGDREKVKEWLVLGRASATASERIDELRLLPGVKSIISKSDSKKFELPTTWAESWPDIVTELDTLWVQSQSECAALREELNNKEAAHKSSLQKKDDDLKSELQKKEAELKTHWEDQVRDLNARLQLATEQHNTKISKLKTLDGNVKTLSNELKTTKEKKEQAERDLSMALTSLQEYRDMAAAMEHVRTLSQHLRSSIQGYLIKQQEGDGEMRPVGIIAALINFSLYQLCLSIMAGRPPLKKAMAQNLFRASQIFSHNSNFQVVRETLLKIESEASAQPEGPAGAGGDTIDNTLFKAFLSRVKTDTNYNLGPFFIDERDDKITRANPS